MKLTRPPQSRYAALAALAVPLLSTTSLAQRTLEARPAPTTPTPEAVSAPTPTPPMPDAASLAALGRPTFDAVAFDEPGDGNTWARGEVYKASFGPRGAEYTPAFGPRSPRNEVVSLSPASVTVNGALLSFDRSVEERRVGTRVDLDRGAFVERYDLTTQSIEQSFVFDTLPSRGEIVVRIPISSDEPTADGTPYGTTLTGVNGDRGIELQGDLGRVTYSRAVAIDARGRRADVSTTFVDGEIVLTVGAAFVAEAALPLVIDPVVSTVHFDSTTSDTFSPDACWNNVSGYWFVSYVSVYSLVDSDVYSVSMGSNGAIFGAGWVDFSGNSWTAARCASNWGNNQILVVAEIPSAVPRGVWGRTVQYSGGVITLGAPYDIAGTGAGDKSAPDVGGDPYPGTASYYCVTWTHALGTNDSEVGYAVVGAANQFLAGPTYFTHQPVTGDGASSVSKMNGTSSWLIAWQHADLFSPTRTDIYGARVNWSGSLTNNSFVIAAGTVFEFAPCVSSPLTGTNQNLVVYTRRQLASQTDIGATLVDGNTVGQTVNLTTIETGPAPSVDQSNPSVDSDGSHFVVAYSEYVPAFLYNDLYAAEVFLSGTDLRVIQGHSFVYNVSLPVLHPQVAATGGTGALSNRYFIPFDITQNSADHDVSGSFFDGVAVGTAQPFCFGDGTSVACPCGINGGAKRGCANGSFSNGAQLTQTVGPNNVSSDGVVLQVGNVPVSSVCLFFQGTTQTAHNVFGDGLRCTGGTIVRLGVETAVGVFANYPGVPGDLPVSQKGLVPATGGSRAYQVWYRDSNPTFCTASTFNVSNGVMIHWLP